MPSMVTSAVEASACSAHTSASRPSAPLTRLTVASSESFSRFTVRASLVADFLAESLASLAHASTSKSRAAPFYVFSPETFSVFSSALASESPVPEVFSFAFSPESSAASAFAFPLKSLAAGRRASTMPTMTLFSFSPSFGSSFNFSFLYSLFSPALFHIPE